MTTHPGFRISLAVLAFGPLLANAAAQSSTQRISIGFGGGSGAQSTGGTSDFPSISADGHYVAYSCSGDLIVAGDTNNTDDVFLVDTWAGSTQRISVSTSGAQGNSQSLSPQISADGRYIVFYSTADNLVAGDTNNSADIFLHDMQTGATTRVSVDSAGVQANDWCAFPAISRDGRFVSFSSGATNLAAGSNGWYQVYVRDLQAGTTVRASVSTSGGAGNFGDSGRSALSADGRFIAFESRASNLVANDNNLHEDVFVRDMLAGTTTRVSVSSSGAEANGDSQVTNGRSISDSGLRIAFHSLATNLVSGDTNQNYDVFVRDVPSAELRRVSHGPGKSQGNGWSMNASISGDGRFVAFASSSDNLVDGDNNSQFDAFVYDWRVDALLRVSVSTSGVEANGATGPLLDLSYDGRYALFSSQATNLDPLDTWFNNDIYMHDRGAPIPSGFCSGDGSGTLCPCSNSGIPGKGCENSGGTGGALLGWSGDSSLAADTLQLVSSGELPQSMSVLMQGSDTTPSTAFGDGLLCLGGAVLRLNAVQASAGSATIPGPGQLSISTAAHARGDLLHPGSVRFYQVYYRDGDASFCPAPAGGTANLSSALAVTWKP